MNLNQSTRFWGVDDETRLQTSNNGDTLAKLETQLAQCESEIEKHSKSIKGFKIKLAPVQKSINACYMEKANLWTRIRVWKNEMGIKQ